MDKRIKVRLLNAGVNYAWARQTASLKGFVDFISNGRGVIARPLDIKQTKQTKGFWV